MGFHRELSLWFFNDTRRRSSPAETRRRIKLGVDSKNPEPIYLDYILDNYDCLQDRLSHAGIGLVFSKDHERLMPSLYLNKFKRGESNIFISVDESPLVTPGYRPDNEGVNTVFNCSYTKRYDFDSINRRLSNAGFSEYKDDPSMDPTFFQDVNIPHMDPRFYELPSDE